MPKLKDEFLATEDQKKRLKTAQDKFYAILKRDGFEDIENADFPDRPLKEWHNHKFSSESSQSKMAIREEYQKLIDDFTNSKDFEDVCIVITKHGNCKLSIQDIKEIWNDNSQLGHTERDIAEKFNKSKTCIHGVLERLRKWMSLV